MKIGGHTLVASAIIAAAIGAHSPARADAVVSGAISQETDYPDSSTFSTLGTAGPNFGSPAGTTTIDWSSTCSTCSGYGLSGSGAAKVIDGALGASASVTVTGSPGANYLGEADSYTQYTDTLTITGGTGSGVLALTYAVDGSFSQSGSGFNDSFTYVAIFDAPGVYSQLDDFGITDSSQVYFSASTPSGTATFYVPFTYGTAFSIEPIMRASADFYAPFDDTTPFTETTAFDDTATLDSALVFAGTPSDLGSENLDAAIASVTGLGYGPDGIVGVPEPGTLTLFGAALLGLGALRRRRTKA